MKQSDRNLAFYLKYYSALYGVKKTEKLIRKFVSGQKLIYHTYFDKMFPNGKMVLDELDAEGEKVFCQNPSLCNSFRRG